ncbi:MAG TPA: MmcQ/YjbR family DNA-binding protein [Actinospica sp.]|nr:MmcQ/YjbR family DNA-binding protein [Actinospica sp.]
MATWDDVRACALALPETVENSLHGDIAWRVRDKLFAWERPLRRSDLEALGKDAPDGPILGVRVQDLGVKEAMLAAEPGVLFTTPHFDRYPAILVRLAEIGRDELRELIIEAWLCRAPKRVIAEWEKQRPAG